MTATSPKDLTTIVVRFTAHPDRVEDLRRAISPAIPRLSRLDGCAGGSLYYDMDEPNVFVIIEHWESPEAHKAYLAQIERDGTMDTLRALLAEPPKRRYLEAHES